MSTPILPAPRLLDGGIVATDHHVVRRQRHLVVEARHLVERDAQPHFGQILVLHKERGADETDAARSQLRHELVADEPVLGAPVEKAERQVEVHVDNAGGMKPLDPGIGAGVHQVLLVMCSVAAAEPPPRLI